MNKNSIRILTISLNAWNDSISTGNTFSNLFNTISCDNISNIYCREESIQNNICKNYFQITEKDILTHIFSKDNCGKVIKQKIDQKQQNSLTSGNQLGSFFRVHRPALLLMARELIWSIGNWKNKNLDDFLEKFSPDIIYMHGHNNLYMHKLLSYCQKKTGAKVVLFFGDDMYGFHSRMPLQVFYQILLRRRLKKSIEMASLLFGGTQRLCDIYSKIFHKEFHVLYKSCDLSNSIKKIKTNNPIRIVYAGNLLFGRIDTLIKLCNEIKYSNEHSKIKFKIEIYSGTKISQKEKEILEDKHNSAFLGLKNYNEICSIMGESDIVLHVESWEKKQINKTRLSFSTKIIDCMQSGSALFAIGPEESASIDYIKKMGCTFVAYNQNEIREIIERIKVYPDIIHENADKMRIYAKENHDSLEMQDRLFEKLMNLS